MRNKIRFGAVVALAFGVAMPIVLAASHTLTYTTAQDTTIQQRIIRNYNRDHCRRFGRNQGCGSGQLVSNGCVVQSVCTASGLRVGSARCTEWSTENVESCVIFTEDASGQAAYLKEVANKEIAVEFAKMRSYDTQDFCTGWDLMNNSSQNALCTTAPPSGLGLSNNCRPCPEVQ